MRVAPPEVRAALDACRGEADDHLLRRAVASGEPTWIANVAVDPRLSGARRDALGCVRSICAVPVASGGRVVAVVELFAGAPTVPDRSRYDRRGARVTRREINVVSSSTRDAASCERRRRW